MNLPNVAARTERGARSAGSDADVARDQAASLKPAVGRGIPENKRDDLLGRYFAGTQGVLARPQSVKVEADDVAASERSREQGARCLGYWTAQRN
jgi:hypothetical protein